MRHQFIARSSGKIRTESLYGDAIIRTLYSPIRENAPALFKAFTSARASQILGFLNYDLTLGARVLGNTRFLKACGVNLEECLDPPEKLDTARKVFERKLRFWECRPMPENPAALVSPADARVLVGSLQETSGLFIKDKFFDYRELLGLDKKAWHQAFDGGDFAIFRLTPDKYHYNHTPVAGEVVDFYEIEGDYHSCNPNAVVAVVTPYSKNKRVVTVIDTDVSGGSGIGLVAMIEVVALMIGDIVQCYSENHYDNPCSFAAGLFLRKGLPKSLYRPGSSTDVVICQKGKVRFAEDLLQNQRRGDVKSRFSLGFNKPLVETDIQVRSLIAVANR